MRPNGRPEEPQPDSRVTPQGPAAPGEGGKVPSPSSAVLRELLRSSVVLEEDWQRLPPQARDELVQCADTQVVLSLLTRHGVLSAYQADRIQDGRTFGLLLGNYRVLDRLGAGGMGVVFQAEHLYLRKQVAIKVLSLAPEQDPRLVRRFFSEVRAVAQLRHPNIVAALDAGQTPSPEPGAPSLCYFVMEYVPGQDLDRAVRAHGPFPPAQAAGLCYQAASALAEAHGRSLVHRDIKPSNVMVTQDGQVKVLDFGLVRQFGSRLTEPGTVLGTLEYLAPEQARDASAVDIRADIYGLGGTLFWCLTGWPPFPTQGSPLQALIQRMTQSAPSARTRNPQVPAALDAVLARMLACDPDNRYPTPQAVMNALLPFLQPQSQEQARLGSRGAGHRPVAVPGSADQPAHQPRVLVVDDSAINRHFCVRVLREAGIACDEVADGAAALKTVASAPYDLILTDWVMPDLTGLDLSRKLREDPVLRHLKILLFSATLTDEEVAQALAAGADDYLTKQFGRVQLVARVQAALRLKAAQERGEALNQQLLAANQQLERALTARDSDLVHLRNALVLGLAELAAHRAGEAAAHLLRLQRYSRSLAEAAAALPAFAGQIDEAFVQLVEGGAPLHDIGKVALPDHVLANPANLAAEERQVLQSHTTIGAEALQKIARRHGPAVAFLQVAIDIARHHHERYDGKGYPDRLAGSAIPLAARIVTIGDVYDTLRSRQLSRPALSHAAAAEVMLEGSPGQFDPVLLDALRACLSHFEDIFRELQGDGR